MDAIELARWVHVVAVLGWLGAVVVVAFVLVPALLAAPESRVSLLTSVFPRVFKLASVLIVVGLSAGATLFVDRYGMDAGVALETSSGRALVAGAVLGGVIATFHFFIEPSLDRRIAGLDPGDARTVDQLLLRLRIIPRVGLLVLVAAALLMTASARGWLA